MCSISKKSLDPVSKFNIETVVFSASPQPFLEFIYGNFDFYEASAQCQVIGGQLAVLSNPVAAKRALDELTSRFIK